MEQELIYCPDCGQDKPREDFHKCKNRKNGVQLYCRECQNIRTANYRKETEGRYWAHKPGDPYYVYQITNPLGQAYIGYTSTTPNLRWRRHIAEYKYKKGAHALLHKSFTEYGIDNHSFMVIDQTPTRDEAMHKETQFIVRHMQAGKALNLIISTYKVGQFDKKTGELIRSFNSVKEAARILGFHPNYIYSPILGRNRKGGSKGYIWKVLPFDNGFFYDPRKK